eukprot:7004135-Lingulodinium_polyedra.AAC.1
MHSSERATGAAATHSGSVVLSGTAGVVPPGQSRDGLEPKWLRRSCAKMASEVWSGLVWSGLVRSCSGV